MKRKILLVVTGAQAIHKAKKLLDLLKQEHEVKVVVSDFVRKNFAFVNELHPEFLSSDLDGVPSFITLGKWSDAVVVYPASANTLAKYAAGIADNMLLTLLFTTQKDIMFFPSIHDVTVYDGLMARKIPTTIENLGDLVIWPNQIHSIRKSESDINIACEPEEAIEYISNFVKPNKKKAIILYGDPIVSIGDNQYHSLATTAAVKVYRRGFRLMGLEVEAIDVTRQLNDNALMEKLIKTEWDVLLSTVTFDETASIDNGMPLDLKVNYDSLGKIRMLFPKRLIAGSKYCEFEIDALRKMQAINLDGILWNKMSVMTTERVTAKFFILGQIYDMPDTHKVDVGVMVARAIKKALETF